MKRPYYTTILWVLFGFVLFSAWSQLLNAFIHGYMHYGLSHDFRLIHFTYYIPAFTTIICTSTVLIIYILLQKKRKKNSRNEFRFSWFWMIVLLILAIGLEPIVNLMSESVLESRFNDLSLSNYLSTLNFESIFNTMELSTFLGKWTVFLFVLVLIIFKIKRKSD